MGLRRRKKKQFFVWLWSYQYTFFSGDNIRIDKTVPYLLMYPCQTLKDALLVVWLFVACFRARLPELLPKVPAIEMSQRAFEVKELLN